MTMSLRMFSAKVITLLSTISLSLWSLQVISAHAQIISGQRQQLPQPIPQFSDGPQVGAVAEAKREEHELIECDRRADPKNLDQFARLAFIRRCLEEQESPSKVHR
jgi:hypothetical protein